MKKLVFLTIATLSFYFTNAQSYSVPKNYNLDKDEDYAAYEKDVIAAFNYLMEAEPGKNISKRKGAMKFLITWATGSPNVTITLFSDLTPSMDGEYLGILFGGWIKAALTSDENFSTEDGYRAGIEAVLTFYEKNKGTLKTDKGIEKFAKLKKKGKLNNYIASKVSE